VCGQIFGAPLVTFAQLESGQRQRARKLSSLEEGPGSGEKNPNVASRESFQGFHPLSGDLCVRLSFAESFTWRIQRNRQLFLQRLKISQPSLGCGDAFRDYNEEPARVSQ
jgi:hypothetical protein